jgi:hypothetical protein
LVNTLAIIDFNIDLIKLEALLSAIDVILFYKSSSTVSAAMNAFSNCWTGRHGKKYDTNWLVPK